MRTSVLLLGPALALSLAACHRAPPAQDNPANAVQTADAGASAGADDELISDQTVEEVLDRTMNRFAKLDLNGDGKLTEDELNAATAGGDHSTDNVQRPREGRSARAFATADANGDGVVTKAEAETDARARFKKLDANGDGKLSKEEAAAGR